MPPKRKVPVKVEEEVVADPDWEAMTVAQLKVELEKRQLDVKGKKADLIKRLQDSGSVDGTAAKKIKTESAPAKTVIQQAIDQLKSAGASTSAVKVFKIDPTAAATGEYKQVHEDYSFMLNQTDIGKNNNKFYVGQVLERNDGKFQCFTKWGRVGETGQTMIFAADKADGAVHMFGIKFKDKTGNKWDDRMDFVKKKGKYHLIDTEGDADDGEDDAPTAAPAKPTSKPAGSAKAKSALDEITLKMVSLIFDEDMFRDAMQQLNIDTKKMPLGKLSKTQIAKGFEALEKIEATLKGESAGDLTELSNNFYTVIPHDFKRTRPPAFIDLAMVQEKFDMLSTLGDIEIAQQMQKQDTSSDEVRHPCDIKYDLLKCRLRLLEPSGKDFKALEKYFDSTKTNGCNIKLRHIWCVDRESDEQRFKLHDDIAHRKLLWHGTNVAVVAAILKSGLRIMPHSGGRVGRGIYFASEHGKSAGYTSAAKGTGLMFLNEVALGKEHEIVHDNSSLKAAPSGYDSVVARGQFEPDPKFDTKLKLGDKQVIVPQGAPIQQSKFSGSNFSQSEYLVYKESQVRIRYMLEFDFSGRGY